MLSVPLKISGIIEALTKLTFSLDKVSNCWQIVGFAVIFDVIEYISDELSTLVAAASNNARASAISSLSIKENYFQLQQSCFTHFITGLHATT